ncbi:LysR family transcriptional regulator [Vreelandella profundi]|uniref:LysR family transcriptional regulator n=1 Tax=Vreelandella profundi TaxID=2852117 RepID=UPI001EEFD34B|nr:LysR family transcriptional regulator [Halomonas profundi]
MKASIRSLEVFRSVMHTGSVSKTAIELNVSQPTASGIIKRLEDIIGVPLFNRLNFGLSPTPEAVQLLPEVERIFDHFAHMQAKIDNIVQGGDAFLAVQSIHSMSKRFVAPTIKIFTELHPRARISIHAGQSSQVIGNVEVGSFDVGFIYGTKASEVLEALPLKKIQYRCIVREDSPLASKLMLDIDDILTEKLILNRSGTYLRQAVERTFQAQGITLTPQIEAGTIQAYELISNGVGIGILDDSLISEGYYKGLVSLPTAFDISVQASLIYNKNISLSYFAKQYIELVCNYFHDDEGVEVSALKNVLNSSP